jgi:hypothetical protein
MKTFIRMLIIGCAASIFSFGFSVHNSRQNANSCTSPEANAFDFQIGVWQQVDGNEVHEITKVLNGCAIQEVWKTDGAAYAFALKSCDEGRHRDGQRRWFYSWVASGYHQLWEGRKEEGQWRFYREWLHEGKPVLSRTYWAPIAENTLERIVEQSRDGGKTWSPHVKERFSIK